MKAIGHAWVALMALERLKPPKSKRSKAYKGYIQKNFKSFYLGDKLIKHYPQRAEQFVKFFDKHKDAFVQGAWFPDNVISDNLTGGHTYKLKKPETQPEIEEAVKIKNRTPKHLSSKDLVKKGFNEKVHVKHKYVLPDRCEALSHAIRDMVYIHKHEDKGSNIMFNNDQITLYFLMLSHYLADAHVPPHCDARDFYKPPTIHPDMEKYWDNEIKKFYEYDKKRKTFDYDVYGAPELKEKKMDSFKESFLYKVLDVLSKREWEISKKEIYLGKNNKKIYDYIKSVCFVSYLVSMEFIKEMPTKDYKKIKILEDDEYKDDLNELSVHVLADAIDSIALVWLLTWDKYYKLEEDIKEKKKDIKKEKKSN